MDLNRKTAFQVLLAVEKDRAYSNLELNNQIKINKPDSPAFVRELVYGVLENKILIDYYIDKLVASGARKIKSQPLVLLRMGIYQLEFMDSVPKYAAINETVKLAKKFAKGRDGFINGVLRNYIKIKEEIELPSIENNPVEYFCTKYSYDKWIVKLWIRQFGISMCEKMLKAMNGRPDISIRINLMKTDKKNLLEKLSARGFDVKEGELSERVLFIKGSDILSSPEYAEGLFSIQDEASVITSDMLDAEPDKTVLDICAAPGGKTLATAELMNNSGRVCAFDIYEHKLSLIEKESRRLGIEIIETSENDGCIYNSAFSEMADCVLVDGPCSGLGVIRRKPEIKYKHLADDGKSLADKQYEILMNSSRYVKRGGTLIYSTCTINQIENQDVSSRFLENNKDYQMVYEHQYLPVNEETDGFYICKMIRKGDNNESWV